MTVRRELDAAGIRDPRLRADYAYCRALAARHGRTYFLATRLLPLASRPAVHALYGFARTADEVVDDLLDPRPLTEQERRLDELAHQLDLGPAATLSVGRAVADTAARYALAPELFADFLTSMRMDLRVSEYETYADLQRYMRGSAEVIGLQMVPVLGTVGPPEEAAPYAATLGVAFQLTNFIRDIGEDLRRGRVYLPQESLRAHGVDRNRLEHAAATGRVDDPIRRLIRHEIARAQGSYRSARPGLPLLDPRARPGIETAFTLYRAILDEVERADYEVFARRVRVPLRRRVPVAGRGLARAVSVQRRGRPDGPAGPTPTASA